MVSDKSREYEEALQKIRNQLVTERRSLAISVNGTATISELVNVQTMIEAVDRAIADEKKLVNKTRHYHESMG